MRVLMLNDTDLPGACQYHSWERMLGAHLRRLDLGGAWCFLLAQAHSVLQKPIELFCYSDAGGRFAVVSQRAPACSLERFQCGCSSDLVIHCHTLGLMLIMVILLILLQFFSPLCFRPDCGC